MVPQPREKEWLWRLGAGVLGPRPEAARGLPARAGGLRAADRRMAQERARASRLRARRAARFPARWTAASELARTRGIRLFN